MKIKPLVEKEINRFEFGKIFTYRDLTPYLSNPETTVKAVSRLVKNGDIKRFAKGQFYRPKKGIFGEMQLSDTEKLKTFMYQNPDQPGLCVLIVSQGMQLFKSSCHSFLSRICTV